MIPIIAAAIILASSKHGQPFRRLTDPKVIDAAKLYSSGMSLTRIGELYDIDGSTVRKELAKIEVRIRKRR